MKMNLSLTLLSLLTIALGLTAAFEAKAAEHTTCYSFDKSAAPTDDPNFSTQVHPETWCYRWLAEKPGSVFLFNVNGDKVTPEMSAIVEPDGTLTHAALNFGKISVHRLKSVYNPMPVPLTPTEGMTKANITLSPEAEKAASNVVAFLINKSARMSAQLLALNVDTRAAAGWVTANVYPWRGGPWAYHAGLLFNGANSPMAKFDRFFSARGDATQAQNWESQNHSDIGVKWAGHCNGWAAASTLRPEPTLPLYDAASQTTFSVSDMKGLLTEKDFCARIAFFGNRNNGLPGDDPLDIYPQDFHNTIVYYVGQLHKPVVADIHADPSIRNHVISGYYMTGVPVGPNTYDITMRLQMHQYDEGPSDTPGTAVTYNQDYRYRGVFNAQGQMISGQWQSENPDFLWVPLSPMDCSPTNPNVTEARIQQILALPQK
jgi:hypothetical protein